MSQFENIFDPARLVLYQPNCPKCGARMWLARIEPDEPGHDKRIFECPQCESVTSEIVKYR
jgi:ribosomal protein S27AE